MIPCPPLPRPEELLQHKLCERTYTTADMDAGREGRAVCYCMVRLTHGHKHLPDGYNCRHSGTCMKAAVVMHL
jgi:hypothetical protein